MSSSPYLSHRSSSLGSNSCKRARLSTDDDYSLICQSTTTPNPSTSTTKNDTTTVTPCPSRQMTETEAEEFPCSFQRQVLLEEAGYDCCSPTTNTRIPKRSDYLQWDEYFMALAVLSSHRSKDPEHPHGACLVSSSNRILGVGYSGFPKGNSDEVLPWTRLHLKTDDKDLAWLASPEPYRVPAVTNAILNRHATPTSTTNQRSKPTKLYTTIFPSPDCAKSIVQAGDIGQVLYLSDLPAGDDRSASRILLRMAGIVIQQLKTDRESVDLDFSKALTEQERKELLNAETKEKRKSETQTPLTSSQLEYRSLLIREAGYDPVTDVNNNKKKNILSWDDYFTSVALLTAQRSKDPNTQVGACLVDPDTRHVLGVGYNGFAAGCSDDVFPWSRKSTSCSALHTKYPYVCHAEHNAILNKGTANVRGATMYVALFPCNTCAMKCIQAGIREVVYMSDRYHESKECRASRIMLEMAGVTYRRHVPAPAVVGSTSSNSSILRLLLKSEESTDKQADNDN